MAAFFVKGFEDVSYGKLVRAVAPFILVMAADLLLITYTSAISMFFGVKGTGGQVLCPANES
ncbi:hypothetical protein [Bacillus infantis]|uniref:hypothetical protein n=1 Tax=Bacillus infantis TaxID=324767 RepID=UPI0021E607ED|nr:hypothetical protein [Bacillus infantis]